MNLYEAMFVRQTAKKFLMDEIDQSVLSNIKHFANHINLLGEGCQPQYKIIDSSKPEYEQIIKIAKKAPYYFLYIASREEECYLNAGYVMGQISLYCTSKGLGYAYCGECRIGSYHENNQIVMCLAIGRTNKGIYREPKQIKKLLNNDNCIVKEELTLNMKTIVQSVKLIPAYLTFQPLRFVVYENRIHIFGRSDTLFSRLKKDFFETYAGFAISNASLAAEELWLDISVKRLENIAEKNLKGHEYLTSIILKALQML